MWRVLLIFFALGLLFIGCAGSTHYKYTHFPAASQVPYRHVPVYVDIQFGDEDKLNIENAINTWNYVLNGYIKFDIVSFKFDMDPGEIKKALNENGVLILKIRSDNPVVPPVEPGEMVMACAERGGNLLYLVRDKIPTDRVEYVTLHELGHILGAPDTDSGILMDKRYSPRYSMCVDKQSMEYVAAYQHLDPNKLNYCFYDETKT